MGRQLTPEEKAAYEAKRRGRLKEASEQMGLKEEFVDELEKKAREAVLADDEWEKELDRKNRAKAGIE